MADSVLPGPNIVRAMRVIRTAHREVARMLVALDDAAHKKGWEPLLGRSWLGLSQTGAQIGDPLNWLAGTVRRAYVPAAPSGQPKEHPREAIAIYEVRLEPTAADGPLVTGVRALIRPTSPGDLWIQWNWSFLTPWHDATKPGQMEVDASQVATIIPVSTPQTLVVQVQALVELDSLNLEERLVKPVLG